MACVQFHIQWSTPPCSLSNYFVGPFEFQSLQYGMLASLPVFDEVQRSSWSCGSSLFKAHIYKWKTGTKASKVKKKKTLKNLGVSHSIREWDIRPEEDLEPGVAMRTIATLTFSVKVHSEQLLSLSTRHCSGCWDMHHPEIWKFLFSQNSSLGMGGSGRISK